MAGNNNNNNKFDIDAIREKAGLVDVIGGYVPLQKDGTEHKACCPFHDEKTPSFTVNPNKGFYHCFGCGAHGDVFDFVMEYERVDFAQACEILGGERLPGDEKPVKKKRREPVDPYAGIEPVPVNGRHQHIKPGAWTPDLFNPKRADDPQKCITHFKPSMVFPYRTAEGALLGYVIRADFGDGEKITPTLQYCQLPDGGKQWVMMRFNEPRPLYGLDRLAAAPDTPVLMLEGEKACDAVRDLVGGDYVCIAWPQGTNGRHQVDWSPLAGRRVLVWLDMDTPGNQAALGHENTQGDWKPGVCEYALQAGAAEVKYVAWDTTKEKGWDGADAVAEGRTKKQVYDWLGSFIKPFKKPRKSAQSRKRLKGGKPAELPPVAAYTPDEAAPRDWQYELQRNDKGGIKNMVSNIVLILANDAAFEGGLAFCDLSYRILKRRPLLDHMVAGEWTDADTSHVLDWLGRVYHFDPPKNKVIDALVVVAQHHRFHPVREYLNSLQWDGNARLDNWLEDAFDARPKNENPGEGYAYLRRAGRYFLIGAVARVMEPPVKMDNVLILEGQQGEGKSTALNILFGDWFSDSPIPIGDKDAYQIIQGTWCNELGELDSFNKAESTSAKLFFSSKSDRYRPSYGTIAQDFPRQCVFAGTTNQNEYLKDYTGNRRYWPVYCMTVDLGIIRAQRDQLWAEAMHYYTQGLVYEAGERDASTRWWTTTDEKALFEAEQDARLQVDPWQTYIEDYLYAQRPEYVQSVEIIENALADKKAGQVTRADQNRVAPIMHALGWENTKKRVTVAAGLPKQPRNVYVRPDSWPMPEKPGGGDPDPFPSDDDI